jgi:hypothetical protein
MFLLDGYPLQIDVPFEHNGVSYPQNWLRLATPEERAAIGITEVAEQPRPDDRFYFVSGPNLDGSWTAIPKDLAGLKTTWTAQFKQTAYTMLLPSDWLIIRKQEIGTEVPADWTSYREAVRTTTALAIGDMEAATDIEAFIASVTSVQWPVSPDSQPVVVSAPEQPVAPTEEINVPSP